MAESRPQPELGLQAFTYRHLNFEEVLAKAEALGIRAIQAYPNLRIGDAIEPKFNHNMDAATRARVLARLKATGIRVPGYGVVRARDEAEWRRIFAFAVALGMTDIAAEPAVEFLPLLDRLSMETGVKVAIHNHAGSRNYDNPVEALAFVAPYGSNIGLCADTGHWVRSGFDPVASLRQAEGRIVSLHFKDVVARGVKTAMDTPWGTGAADVAGQILELRRQRFAGVVYLEYERLSPTLDEDVRRSADYFRRALAATDDDLRAGRVRPPDSATEPSSTRRPLFAPDLSDAEFKPGTWIAENNIIVAQGVGDLWTKDSYGNFALSLEFRAGGASNSGVILRMSDPSDWMNNSIEVQILSTRDENPTRNTAAMFDLVPPARPVHVRSGEWHRLEIVAVNTWIEVTFDGERTTTIDLGRWTEPGRNPNGSPNRFKHAIGSLPRSGRIGFQFHGKGEPVAFRNIMIQPLP